MSISMETEGGIPQSLRRENTSMSSAHYIFDTFEPNQTPITRVFLNMNFTIMAKFTKSVILRHPKKACMKR